MTIRPDLAGLRVLAGLFALALLPACGQIEIPVHLNLDPAGANTLELVDPVSGEVLQSQLVGGAATTIVLDTDQLLTWQGVFATLQVDDVRIAGTSFLLLGALPTGTICMTQDPDAASGGFAYLRPLLDQEADVQLTLATLAYPTNLAALAPPLPFGATLDTQVPLDLGDLLALAAGEEGSLTLTETITDTLPPDVLFLGGSELTVTVTLTNSDAPASGPLLDECDAFFAGLP